jgi:fumarate reductase subunit C
VSRRPFVREVSATRWYFRHPRYLRYMSREVTCVFVAALALLLLYGLVQLSRGPAAWSAFIAALQGVAGVAGLLLILVFALHNTFSWFNVAPKAMPVQIGEGFLPGKVIVIAHYAAWIVASLAVLYLAGAF